jgi:hypothetical protein
MLQSDVRTIISFLILFFWKRQYSKEPSAPNYRIRTATGYPQTSISWVPMWSRGCQCWLRHMNLYVRVWQFIKRLSNIVLLPKLSENPLLSQHHFQLLSTYHDVNMQTLNENRFHKKQFHMSDKEKNCETFLSIYTAHLGNKSLCTGILKMTRKSLWKHHKLESEHSLPPCNYH